MKPVANKEPKKNCFAYDKGKCNALKELVCSYKENCAFYTHRADVNIKKIERDITNYSLNKAD